MRRLPLALALGIPAATLAFPAPDGPGDVMPDRRWDVAHLDLDVTLDLDKHTIAGTATHTVRALGAPASTVRLHQHALIIDAITVDGVAVPRFDVGTDTLDIPVPAGDQHTVAVTFHARPDRGLHFRDPAWGDLVKEVWSQGEGTDNRFWYPAWDYPNDRFTVRTRVTAASDLEVAAVGALVDKQVNGPTTTWTWAVERPIVNYLVALGAGEWEVHKTAPGHEIVAPRGLGAVAAVRTLGRDVEMTPFFEDLLDEKFPFPVHRQVLVQRFMFGGMENPGFTTMDWARYTRLSDLDPSERTDSVVAHELAHQWFGDLLTCYGWREMWLNEGFASFYAGRWHEHTDGRDAAAVDVRNWMDGALGDPAPLAPRRWTKIPGRDSGSVYDRGASVLQMARVFLGDDVFDASIRAYVEQHKDRLVESEDLRRVFEDTSGRNLAWLFDGWVYDGGAPTLSASHTWDDGVVRVGIDQSGDKRWPAPIEVEIGLADGKIVTHTVWTGPDHVTLAVPAAQAPLWVAVDPRDGVLAHWTRTQSAEAWRAQLIGTKQPAAALAALRALAELPASDPNVAAVAAVASSTRHASLRAAAVRTLGALQAIDALDARAADPAWVVRAAVADALPKSSTPSGAPIARRLLDDPVPEVRAAALQALARIEPEAALALARRWLTRPDPTPRQATRAAAIDVIGRSGDKSDLARLTGELGDGRPRPSRGAAARAIVEIAGRMGDAGDKPREALAVTLVHKLDDPDLRGREQAIGLLAEVGGPDQAAALQAYAARIGDAGQAELARDAAARIRGRAKATPAADDDVERLRERLDALDKRLKRVESRP